MAKSHAAGKEAWGICDRCGFRYKLKTLKHEKVNNQEVGLKVCKDCFDPDHPQNKIGRQDFSDPQALKDPRPDTSIPGTRGSYSLNPSGGLKVTVLIGDGLEVS